MQLRVLSTLAEVANERNSTLIFPLPVELLRWLDSQNGSRPASPEQASPGVR